MASVSQSMTDPQQPAPPTPPAGKPTPPVDASERPPGFFTILKPGQGYWTRLGTAIGVALIGIVSLIFIYAQLRQYFTALQTNRPLLLGIVSAIAVVAGLLVWRMLNSPRIVEFLIATDGEMRKVNWTTRRELIGSTRVVIIFMLATAAILFGFDLLFGYLFYLIDVLKSRPF